MQRVLIFLITTLLICFEGASAQADRVLRFGANDLPPGLGNPYTATSIPSNLMWSALFDGLTQLDEAGKVVPALATSWEIAEPTRWLIHLQDNVVFSNGEPFDADAVVATFGYLMSNEGKGTAIGNEVRGFKAVRSVGRLTVEIKTTVPDALVPNRLVAIFIVAPKAWGTLGPDGFAQTPSGTGPFKLTSWGQGTGRATVAAAPQSWRWNGPPNFDRMEFFDMPDASMRTQALLSGQIDMMVGVVPDDVELVRQSGFGIHISPVPQVMSLALINVKQNGSPTEDQRIRQALNYAVNKDIIADVIMHGFAEPAGQGATPVTFGFNPSVKPYAYDPARAKELLAEAGYTNGFTMSADVIVGSSSGDSMIYQTVKQNLATVGVELTLRPTVFSDWFRKYINGSFKGDAFGLSWYATPYNDAQRPMEYFSCLNAKPFFCDPSVVPLLEAATAELNRDKRLALLHELQQRYHDMAPAIFLIQQSEMIGFAPNVSSVSTANRVVRYESLEFADDGGG